MSRYSDTLLQSSKIQTHASQLDGTANRGNFRLHTALHVESVVLKSDKALDWQVSFLIPNPEDPIESNWIKYLWLEATALNDVVDAVQMSWPMGTRVIIETNGVAASNPKVQVITKSLMPRQE